MMKLKREASWDESKQIASKLQIVWIFSQIKFEAWFNAGISFQKSEDIQLKIANFDHDFGFINYVTSDRFKNEFHSRKIDRDGIYEGFNSIIECMATIFSFTQVLRKSSTKIIVLPQLNIERFLKASRKRRKEKIAFKPKTMNDLLSLTLDKTSN